MPFTRPQLGGASFPSQMMPGGMPPSGAQMMGNQMASVPFEELPVWPRLGQHGQLPPFDMDMEPQFPAMSPEQRIRRVNFMRRLLGRQQGQPLFNPVPITPNLLNPGQQLQPGNLPFQPQSGHPIFEDPEFFPQPPPQPLPAFPPNFIPGGAPAPQPNFMI